MTVTNLHALLWAALARVCHSGGVLKASEEKDRKSTGSQDRTHLLILLWLTTLAEDLVDSRPAANTTLEQGRPSGNKKTRKHIIGRLFLNYFFWLRRTVCKGLTHLTNVTCEVLIFVNFIYINPTMSDPAWQVKIKSERKNSSAGECLSWLWVKLIFFACSLEPGAPFGTNWISEIILWS